MQNQEQTPAPGDQFPTSQSEGQPGDVTSAVGDTPAEGAQPPPVEATATDSTDVPDGPTPVPEAGANGSVTSDQATTGTTDPGQSVAEVAGQSKRTPSPT